MQIGDRRNQVGIAATLTQPVDSALDLHRAGAHRGDGVGHRDFGVVMAMDTDRTVDRGASLPDRILDLEGQPPAVGVAQADKVNAGVRGRGQALQRELGAGRYTVEEVFRVEDYLVHALFQKRDRVVDYLEVLLVRDAQRLADVQVPGLAHNRRHRRTGAQNQLQVAILRRFQVGAAGRAESGDFGVAQLEFLHLGEKGRVALVGPRPSAFDVVEAELVEPGRDRELVIDGERNVLGLASVAQRGVVELDFFWHRHD